MDNTPLSDLERLKREYSNRSVRLKDSDIYSGLNLSYLFMVQQRERAVIELLGRIGLSSLTDKRILDVGCGYGDVIQQMMLHRIASNQIHGADLLSDRLFDAKKRFGGTNFVNADAQYLPYADHQFDLVLQYTVFSSILDDEIKQNIAHEMLRVLKSDGVILWYDFWLNPTNRQTKGVRLAEIRRLFPNCELVAQRVTLAPPLARKLVPISWTLSLILEKFRLLNTHYLVAIKPT
jgi:ubiquinone/menaquinone biosynthesis C-methylase UbiE